MKTPSLMTLTALVLSSFIFKAAIAQTPECSQAKVNNTAILKAALNLDLELPEDYQLYAGTVQRSAIDKALATLTFTDGYQVSLNTEIACDGTISVTRKPDAFRCVAWVDCMPSDSVERVNYCTKAYFAWAKKNCEKQPMVVQ